MNEKPQDIGPIQFNLLSLFFLTAFSAALVMSGMEAQRADSLWLASSDPFSPAMASGRLFGYLGLAFVLAVATVASMVRRRDPEDSQQDSPNSLAPPREEH